MRKVISFLLLLLSNGSLAGQGLGWVRYYEDHSGRAFDLVISAQECLIVTGSIEDDNNNTSTITMKYDTSGNHLWTRIFDLSPQTDEKPVGLTPGPNGTVYVGIQSTIGNENNGFRLLAYDKTGNELWAKSFAIEGTDISTLGSGHVVLTGWHQISDSLSGIFVQAHDSSGQEIWQQTFIDSLTHWSVPADLAVDLHGNTYVTGITGLYSGRGPDYLTVKYDIEGNLLWSQTLDIAVGESATSPTHIKIDNHENVYIIGHAWSVSPDQGGFVRLKIDSAGSLLWSAIEPRAAQAALALDKHGNLIVAGTDRDRSEGRLIKYDVDGNEVWYKTPAGIWTEVHSNGKGKFFVAGCTMEIYPDLRTVLIDELGNTLSSADFSRDSMSTESLAGMVADASGSIYLAATSAGYITLLKYSGSFPVAVNDRNPEVPLSARLFQNYPNPFNPSTTIRYETARSGDAELSLYNLLGQKVKTLFHGVQTAGLHQVEFQATDLPSGVYIYQIKSGGFFERKKLLLLK